MSAPFVRRSVFAGAAGLINAAGTFASGVIVARALGPEGAGIVSLATWIAIISATFAGLGLPVAIQRYLPELQGRMAGGQAEALTGRFFRLVAGSTLVTACVLGLAWFVAPQPVGALTWTLIVVCFAAQSLGDFFYAHCSAAQRFGRLAALTSISVCLRLTVLAIGVLTLGLPGALLAYAAGFILPAALSLPFLQARGELPREVAARAVRFSASAWLVGVVYVLVWTRAEIVFIEAYWGAGAVGLFAAGLGLANLAMLLPLLLTRALLPYLSEQVSRGALAQTYSAYRSMIIIVALAVLPICFGTAAIAPELIPLLFGEAFVAAVPSGMVLIATSATATVAVCTHTLLFSFERGPFLLLSHVMGITLIVAAGLLVVPAYGLLGAAWSRAAVHAAVAAVEVAYVRRQMGFALPVDPLIRILAASALCGACAYAAVWAVGGLASLAIAVPAGAAVYVLAARRLAVLEALDREMLERAASNAPFRLEAVIRLGVALLDGRRGVPKMTG